MAKKAGILNQNNTPEIKKEIVTEDNLEKNVASELPIENDLNIKLTSEPTTEDIMLKSTVHGDIDESETTDDEDEDIVTESQEIKTIEKIVSHNIGGDADLSKDAIRFYLRTGIKL